MGEAVVAYLRLVRGLEKMLMTKKLSGITVLCIGLLLFTSTAWAYRATCAQQIAACNTCNKNGYAKNANLSVQGFPCSDWCYPASLTWCAQNE